MSRSSCAYIAAALLLAASMHAPAEDVDRRTGNVLDSEGRSPLSGQVESLHWLAGRWTGEGLGGVAEYVIAPPSSGTILLAFKLSRDGAMEFYEILVIGEFGGRTALRLKHFHANLAGWEAQDEWVEFPLLRVEPGRAAWFDGLTYRLNDDGTLSAFVIARTPDGVERELAFHFHRE
jgi:hypothetical protein